jgi:type II restriction enzyme
VLNVLLSRNLVKEEFVEEFLNTLKAGIIRRKEFINWDKIDTKFNDCKFELDFFSELITKEDKLNYLRDSLLSVDDPYKLVKLCFELLAHTPPQYVSWEDNINIKKISQEIQNGFIEQAEKLITVLSQLGFLNVLTLENIYDYFKGILVGLETHKRKNVGGSAYIDYVKPFIEKIVSELKEESFNLELVEENKIDYLNSSQSKKVDFAIKYNNKIKVGIEVNFYTNTGSKPTEIKRSYGEVNRRLNEQDIELVWITDGFGYTIMKKSLGDAFEIHKNTYNIYMLEKHFKEDLKSIFN